ncbi:hypothetical protein BCR33DRAFT_720911 [Rhizoclosmatium globosum]|uniref:C2H2-type domain-containing protein n=1 Tax=Rhizoclosmatium globosum TaxID=329046 RepID=A0A1Y2BVT0_9FUNG|nr:hypothetical protein BCR33DRAFT_720911 [Rhizoclosmatium globosum]|eukprot:ORY38205.1 hypothetical protein BCR33DRAFT_720911 [Rhizoclosmatium globosum]
MSTQTSTSAAAYTCLSCRVSFDSAEYQRNHFRSDWHKYNLKRKVVELPPIDLQEFSLRVQAGQENAAQIAQASELQYTCTAFGNVHSVKDSESTRRKEDETDSYWRTKFEQAESEDELQALVNEKLALSPSLETTNCLFCPKHFQSIEENVAHMSQAHSFLIPDSEYVFDLEGLIQYLADKVSLGNLCLYCNDNGKPMYSLEAVRAHMENKGHCKLAYSDEDKLELADFYDFTLNNMQLVSKKASLFQSRAKVVPIPTSKYIGGGIRVHTNTNSLVSSSRTFQSTAMIKQRLEVLAVQRAKQEQNLIVERKVQYERERVGIKANNDTVYHFAAHSWY